MDTTLIGKSGERWKRRKAEEGGYFLKFSPYKEGNGEVEWFYLHYPEEQQDPEPAVTSAEPTAESEKRKRKASRTNTEIFW